MVTTTQNLAETLRPLVGELMMLFQESAEFQRQRGNPHAQAVLQEATRMVAANSRRLSMDRYVMAMVGLTNVGKSTLLNALLGGELAPRRNGPCTAAPIEFCYGDRLQVIAHYTDSFMRQSGYCENVNAVHHYLSQLADDAGAEVARRTRKVEVFAPVRLLKGGAIIADTPGFGAAQEGDAAGSHEEALKQYLHREVSQVLWVVYADNGIGKREKDFHDEFFQDVCHDIVVTGCEEWNQSERERFRQRFSEAVDIRLPRFHFVSGLKGLEARIASDVTGLRQAGIIDLEARISELSATAGQTSAMVDSLCSLAGDVSFWLRSYRDERRLPLKEWWRPDSWSRWSACMSENVIKVRLSSQLRDAL